MKVNYVFENDASSLLPNRVVRGWLDIFDLGGMFDA
jgi:hypothetical protein